MVTKVFGCDSLTADVMIPLKYRSREDIDAIVAMQKPERREEIRAKYHDISEVKNPNLRKGYQNIANFIKRMEKSHKAEKSFGKIYLTKEEFDEFCGLGMGVPTGGTHPGGSSGNTLDAASQILGDAVAVSFMSVVGHGPYGSCVRGGMKNSGIKLYEAPEIQGKPAETAVTFNIEEPAGRTALAYSGNIGKIIKPEMIERHVQDSDIVFIQGAWFEKTGRVPPHEGRSVADNMQHHSYHGNKETWLALPTQSKFSATMTADDYRYLIPSADIILGNETELMNVYETRNLHEAMKLLQADMRKRKHEPMKDKTIRFERQPVAFITNGPDGAYVVPMEGDPIHVNTVAKEGKNLLGAGDASFAGFVVGRKGGLSYQESGELGMQYAAAKMEVPETRLSDPVLALETYSERSHELYQKVKRNLEMLKNREVAISNGFLASTQVPANGTGVSL